MTNPRVSVLMPVYNPGPYLAPAVESILQQTFRAFEFIIVDDGSTDDSLALLHRYQAGDQRIRLISRPNTGIVGALNDGLAVAKGDLVARMDADDISVPDRVRKQLEFMDSHPDHIAVSAAYSLMDPEGLRLWDPRVESDHESIVRSLYNGRTDVLVHGAVMYRRNEVLAAGGYRQEYEWCEDIDLWFRLIELGKVANLPDALLKVRFHFASVCRTRAELQQQRTAAVLEAAHRGRGETVPEGVQRICEALRSGEAIYTPVEHYRFLSVRAAQSGHYRAARKYARRVLLSEPLRRPNYWLLADAYLGLKASLAIKRLYRKMRGLGPIGGSIDGS